MQSIVALDPAGPFAQPLSDLSWLLIAIVFAVLLIVVVITFMAIFAGERLKRVLGKPWLVVGGGLIFPAVVVTGLFFWSLDATAKITERTQPGDLRVRVVGEMWWWRVHYMEGDRVLFETANEIRIPVGRTVAFELQSNDVIHAFWVPQLGGKMDMIPGRTNVLRLQADRAGVYRGQCTEYCGAAHALMALEVVAEPQADFDAWAAAQAAPATATAPAFDLFSSSGCGACHAIRGTPANGMIGPDLTHIGSRRMIAAGILPNDPETLRRFIRHAGELKPGVRMPDYDRLAPQDVDAIAALLESLK